MAEGNNNPILKNLNAVVKYARERYSHEFVWQDITLNEKFKETYEDFLSKKRNEIEYHKHSAVITTRQGQYIFIDNEWFAIASYFVDFCTELLTYQDLFYKICKDLYKDPEAYAKHLKVVSTDLDRIQYIESAKRVLERDLPGRADYNVAAGYLWRFASDYSWWYGSKTVDRGDFYISAVLNQLNVVNASHGFVAEIVHSYASDLRLRRLAENLDNFTIGTETKSYVLSSTEIESYQEAETLQAPPKKATLKISISAASLERFQSQN